MSVVSEQGPSVTFFAFAEALSRYGMRSAGSMLRVLLALKVSPVMLAAALDDAEKDTDEHANWFCMTAAGSRFPEDDVSHRQRAAIFLRLSFVARALRDGDHARARTMLAEVP